MQDLPELMNVVASMLVRRWDGSVFCFPTFIAYHPFLTEVRSRIVRAFLIEEQKCVKQAPFPNLPDQEQ